MKKIHIVIYILILFTAFIACKKDKGNYVYHDVDIPKIDTATLQNTYQAEQFSNLKIEPKISYQGDTSNLNYQWLIYVKSQSDPSSVPAKVLSEKRKLDITVNSVPGTYYLELLVTDKKNQMKTNYRVLLNVLATIENGWLVLQSYNNESDLDFIASKNLYPTGTEKRITGMFKTFTGSRMKGEGQMLGFSRRSSSDFNYITVGNKEGIKRMNGFTFDPMGADQALFRRPLTVKNFQAHINNGSNELIINDGALQSITWQYVPDALYTGVFNGDYYLAPYIVVNDNTAYGALVYDQKFGKFLYTTQTTANLTFVQFKPAAVTNPAQPFSPSNVGKELLFMDRGFNKYAYAFLKDKTGNGRYLYVLNITKTDAGNLAMGAYDMTTLPEIGSAKHFQVGDLGNVALYATDRTVYRFDYSGSGTASITYNNLPVGENITCLRIFKPKLNQNVPSADFTTTNNAVVYIATWNGTEGKLYEMAMNVASGVINPTPLKVYTGFGKITEMVTKFRGSGL